MLLSFPGVVKDPDVPWYLWPSSFAPTGIPFNPPGSGLSPYIVGNALQSPDNPPGGLGTPATFPFHANIQRFWQNGSASYVVVVPMTVPPIPEPEGPPTGGDYIPIPDLTTTISTTFSMGLTGAAGAFTWQNWVDAVRASFDKWSAVPTAQVTSTFVGVVYGRYSMTDGVPAVPAGTGGTAFIWPAAPNGPTGNGVNEIILVDQQYPGTPMGRTSMLVEPATGRIVECDIVFHVGSTPAAPVPGTLPGLFQPNGASGTTLPTEWTAIDHEIGHFFGLDHTNLHPGVNIGTGLPYPPNSYGANPNSRARYPTTIAPPSPLPFPAMVRQVTYLGVGSNLSSIPLHLDDQIGLSKIYPVDMPRPLSPKIPLINVSAAIRGRLTTNGLAGTGMFGPNAWAVFDTSLDVPGQGFPRCGVITGTARITDDPLTTIADPVNPTVNLYRDDRTGAAFFPPPRSIVGAGGSGDFSIDGLPAIGNITSDPLEYDVVFEDSDLLGWVANGAGYSGFTVGNGEWFSAPNALGGFYQANPPLTQTNGLNLLAQQTPPIRPALTFLNNATNTGPRPAASSMSVLPGTIIYLSPAETTMANFSNPLWFPMIGAGPFLPGSDFVTPTVGTSPPIRIREQTVRPLVMMEPRRGRFQTANLTVAVRNDIAAPYGYDLSTARLFVNGVPSQAILGSNGPVTGTVIGPATTTWIIPMAQVVGSVGVNVPIRVSFTINSVTPVNDPAALLPRRIVAGVGRNDVIL